MVCCATVLKIRDFCLNLADFEQALRHAIMKTQQLRQAFLDFFQQRGHTIVSSSSLVPAEDPSLLFTNAGMVQFKDTFLGKECRSYVRAASAQRCVRAGGKHNDLENVGYTARHHTFFEMLGNFSFGDYFKSEAIKFAWTFLTSVLQLSPEKLWITVFKEDDEAADIWLKEIQVNPARFSRCDEKDNFWAMGDIGPCGPCTEIYYDHGPDIPGSPPGTADADGDRFVEIWNLVFMQFNRSADGKLTPLPKPSVDTGMGLERIAAVMQGVHSNYDIDLFRHLIHAVAKLVEEPDKNPTSLRVIADHIRSASFLITDGVMPSNEGRGYVLRRIIRRAVRHGHKLGLKKPFFHSLVEPLAAEMGLAYPELTKARTVIEKVLLHEEEQFAQTLDQGIKLLEQTLLALHHNSIPGDIIFRLYDTYGFPPDLTGDIARERGLSLDYAGFEAAMEKQRRQSQAASQFSIIEKEELTFSGQTEFTGYHRLTDEANVIGLVVQNKMVETLCGGDEGAVILGRTPFYAEAGGQVGDKGQLFFESGSFLVRDTQKKGAVFLHNGIMQTGSLAIGAKVTAEVDASRHAVMLNHSATHLLHAALRRLLGEHVIQKGSLVEADRLRFDFSHFAPLTAEQIKAAERLVNQQIRADLNAQIDFMSPEEAKKIGAMALFNEKYGDEVRVLRMGEFSMELCGGTHVEKTGQIGLFKIIHETGIASGVRRIEAVTGEKALDWLEQQEKYLDATAALLKTSREEIAAKVEQLSAQNRALEKEVMALKHKVIQSRTDKIFANIQDISGLKILVEKIEDTDSEGLRYLIERYRQKYPERSLILLVTADNKKVHLLSGSTTTDIAAGELIKFVTAQLGGKGGGRPDIAQGGAAWTGAPALDAALQSAKTWVHEKLEQMSKS